MKRDCHKAPALKLLPYTVRENLPILGSQQNKRGQAKVWTKCFTADGTVTWYITEGSVRRDSEGRAVDYLLYGLVEGQCRKLEYFWLSDLASVRGPMGLPVRRDSDWQPKSLVEIAPEMFGIDQKQVED
jgi:hypothetical protein